MLVTTLSRETVASPKVEHSLTQQGPWCNAGGATPHDLHGAVARNVALNQTVRN